MHLLGNINFVCGELATPLRRAVHISACAVHAVLVSKHGTTSKAVTGHSLYLKSHEDKESVAA